MTDEKRLRQIYSVVTESWKMFKKYSGTPNSDAKWDAIMAEANRIWKEHAQDDKGAKLILFGFVEALEQEDKEAREHGRHD